MTLRSTTIVQRSTAAVDTITLDSTARHRRRITLASDNGISFLLDLPEARLLRQGECLELDDGRLIKVIAAPEELYEVRGNDGRHLLSLAWQIGNRHLAAQIFGDHIYIRRDSVIKTMLEGLGAQVLEITAPFDPEGGAYSGHSPGGNAGHQHSHD